MHKAINLLVLSILICAWKIPAALAGNADSLLRDLIADIVLVQGQVVEMKKTREDMAEQRAKVLHVYCGPRDLMGSRFTIFAWIPPIGPGTDARAVGIMGSPVPLQTLLIAKLSKDTESHGWISACGYGGFYWPVCESGKEADDSENVDYQHAKGFAAALEQVCQAGGEERWALLRKDSQSQIPELSAWAIRVIAETKPEWKDKFFQELVNTAELPIAGQIALDEAFSDSRGDQWRYSSERASLVSGWLVDRLDERDLWRVMDRVTSLHRRGELDPRALLAICENGLSNAALPEEDREELVGFVLDAFRGAREEASSCYLLFEQAQGSKDEKIRMAAAEKLRECILYYRGLLDHIRELRDKTPDKNVQRILQSALDGPIDKDKFLRDLSTKTEKSANELKLP